MTAADTVRGPAQVLAEASLSVLSWPACTIAMLEGDLDVATIPALRERLFGVLGLAGRLLIIDLSRVSFCDVAALAMLIGARRRASGLGITVRLAAPRPQMAKLLRITGLDRNLAIFKSQIHKGVLNKNTFLLAHYFIIRSLLPSAFINTI